MIEHIFIKNYKAFKKETIVFDKHTLFVGTHKSGKTTILESLDLFFNNHIDFSSIRNLEENIVIELYINDKRYRKVFSPPDYHLNFRLCIGNLYDIQDLCYLYIPSHTINYAKLINDVLNINMIIQPNPDKIDKSEKVLKYILSGLDKEVKNKLSFVKEKYIYEFKELSLDRKDIVRLLSSITNPNVILGVDLIENINTEKLILDNFRQTIFTSKNKKLVSSYKYSVQALYKEDIKQEIDTLTKTGLLNTHKTMLLVEGKYDVAWFETALHLLNEFKNYRVIPCGGFGNIQYIKLQLVKEGFKTLTITDGDTYMKGALEREIIELYADYKYINRRFGTKFNNVPRTKKELFKRISVKDDVVKKVLSGWAKRHLTLSNQFVIEVSDFIKKQK